MPVERQGSGQDVERPGVGRRGLPGLSPDAAPAARENPSAAGRRGCPREGARPPLSLGTPAPEPPRDARESRGPGVEPARRGQVPRGGQRCA